MKKYLFAMGLLILAFGAVAGECYGEGVRIGTVQKFSSKGLSTKSWEGELVMEGVKIKSGSEGTTKGGNVWSFSAVDPAVAKVIDEATMSGASVALKYCQRSPFAVGDILRYDTPYIVTQAVVRK